MYKNSARAGSLGMRHVLSSGTNQWTLRRNLRSSVH